MGALAGTFALAALAAPVAAPNDWHDLLKLRLSPGSVALLIEHPEEPQVLERWRGAIADQSPRVRAAAARLANVAGATSLVPALLAALQGEIDAEAGAEEIQAIMALAGLTSDEALSAAAERLGPSGRRAYAEALARTTGTEQLDRLDALDLGPEDRRTVLYLATRSDRGALNRAASYALRRQDSDAWDAVLSVAREAQASLDVGMMVAALSIPSAAIRNLTYWDLTAHLLDEGSGATLAPAIVSALASGPEASGALDIPAAFSFEILKRARGEKPQENAAWIASLQPEAASVPASLAWETPARALLTPGERSALSVRLTGDPKGLAPTERGKGPRAETREAGKGKSEASASLHTLAALPRGLFSDLLAVSGCRLKDDRSLAGAVITYDATGRPRKVAFLESSLPPACEQAARAALAIGLDDDPRTAPGTSQFVLAVMDDELIHCLDAFDPAAFSAHGSGGERVGAGHIREPKKMRNISPVYPEAAQAHRVQGVVVLEAMITPSGCIGALRLVRSPDVNLSIAALRAVSGWRYTPTLLDGRPVPVIMTVTVNYKLH